MRRADAMTGTGSVAGPKKSISGMKAGKATLPGSEASFQVWSSACGMPCACANAGQLQVFDQASPRGIEG